MSIDASGSVMTENQMNFCKGVAKLCEAAESPELFKPIIKLWALYEDAQTTDNGQLVPGSVGNMSSEEAKKVAAEVSNYAQAKATEEQAAEQAENAGDTVAVEVNNATTEDENKADAGEVNG